MARTQLSSPLGTLELTPLQSRRGEMFAVRLLEADPGSRPPLGRIGHDADGWWAEANHGDLLGRVTSQSDAIQVLVSEWEEIGWPFTPPQAGVE